jgi:hypothetical protein
MVGENEPGERSAALAVRRTASRAYVQGMGFMFSFCSQE